MRSVAKHRLTTGNNKIQRKVFLWLIALALFLLMYDLITNFIFTTRQLLLPAPLGEGTDNFEMEFNSGGDQMSILLYTSYVNTSRFVVDKCCHVDAKMFDRTKIHDFAFNDYDPEADFTARFKFMSRLFKRYHVVLFHVRDAPGARLLKKVSDVRPPRQLWAYYNKESPYNTINVVNGKYDDLFDMTITPSRKSDVFAPYGFYKARIPTVTPDNMTSHVFSYRSSFSVESSHFVAWVVSNCNQLRDKYVLALRKFVPIHIFGKCSRKYENKERVCEKGSIECEETLRQYKFVLAFENSFCDDYITEKYWNALARGNVPIVLGGRKYDSKVAIPGSYINARTFKNAQTLATYLKYLAANRGKYMDYLSWRDLYELDYLPNDHHRFERIIREIHKVFRKHLHDRKRYKLSHFYSIRNCPLHTNDTSWFY